MSEKPSVPATLQTLLLICETDQQREELTHCYYATLGGDPSSPILQLATLISAVAVAGRKHKWKRGARRTPSRPKDLGRR